VKSEALRLSRYFAMSEVFWMVLQADYDLEEAKLQLGKRLQRESILMRSD
jgi:plasmid maintenance system antidote protein VapI